MYPTEQQSIDVAASQVAGRMIAGRLHMTTEARCPYCQKTSAYAHAESHASLGKWYGCKHLSSMERDDSGLIAIVGYTNRQKDGVEE